MARDDLQMRLESMAAQAASARGVEVVEVVYRKQGRHSVLRVDIDRPGTPGVTLEDCEAVSHALDGLLEADDPFGEVPYDLQVSSPGLDRPIRTPDDVRRNAGRRVIVNARVPIEGKRSFKGVLAGGDAAGFRVVRDDGVEVGVPFEDVASLWTTGVAGSLAQNHLGFSPLRGGLGFIPATALVATLMPVSGILGQKLGHRMLYIIMDCSKI